MIKAKEDSLGMTFGRLTVVEYAKDYVEPNGTHRKRCKCLCECGGYNSFDEAVSVRKEAERKYFDDFSYDSSMKRGA